MGKNFYKKMLSNYNFFKNSDIFRIFSHSKLPFLAHKTLKKPAKSLLITLIIHQVRIIVLSLGSECPGSTIFSVFDHKSKGCHLVTDEVGCCPVLVGLCLGAELKQKIDCTLVGFGL